MTQIGTETQQTLSWADVERLTQPETAPEDRHAIVRRLVARAARKSQETGAPVQVQVPVAHGRRIRRGAAQSGRGDAPDPGTADAGEAERRTVLALPGEPSAGAPADPDPQRPPVPDLGALRLSAREVPSPAGAGAARGARGGGARPGGRAGALPGDLWRGFGSRLPGRGADRPRHRPAARRRPRGSPDGARPGPGDPGDGHRRPAGEGRARKARAALLRDLGRPEEAGQAERLALRLAHRAGGLRERENRYNLDEDSHPEPRRERRASISGFRPRRH